ncbi:MAG: DUF4397 domain-containing protein [Chitinophagaceae bacterium]|nr:DUF4397 domain-containing protein [Chitinophagaceae bacterium]
MKKILFNKAGFYSLVLGAIVFASSCKKQLPDPTVDSTPEAFVAVHNFTLLAGTSSSVFVNGSQLSLIGAPVALAVGGTTAGPYIGVDPTSAATIGLRTSTGSANYASRTVTLANKSNTSFFGFDTLTAAGSARMLVLNNNMTAPALGTTNFRFLHFSPNAGPVNVTLVRTADQFGVAASGTITLTNVPYIGASANPDETTLSNFTNIPAGTYTLTVLSGTTALVGPTSVTLREFKNYSIVARGFTSARASIPAGQTLGATLLLHNP